MIYHKVCLSHEVPRDHLEKPDRLRVAISVIHELHVLYPESLDIFTNPPEGMIMKFILTTLIFLYAVEQRYLYLVHDPRYVNKLRSLIPTPATSASSAPTSTSSSNPASPPEPTPPAVRMIK